MDCHHLWAWGLAPAWLGKALGNVLGVNEVRGSQCRHLVPSPSTFPEGQPGLAKPLLLAGGIPVP